MDNGHCRVAVHIDLLDTSYFRNKLVDAYASFRALHSARPNQEEPHEGHRWTDGQATVVAADVDQPDASTVEVLRGAAAEYSRTGWPVLPLNPKTGRLVCSQPPDGPECAEQWWERPYGIACRTGDLFDVLQVPSWLGEHMLPAVGQLACVWEVQIPLVRTWWFMVTPGAPVVAEFGYFVRTGRLHRAGSYVVMPPTPIVDGCSRWVTRQPGRLAADRLPHSLAIQWAAIRAVGALRQAFPAGDAS